jgi:hypothetical protein
MIKKINICVVISLFLWKDRLAKNNMLLDKTILACWMKAFISLMLITIEYKIHGTLFGSNLFRLVSQV